MLLASTIIANLFVNISQVFGLSNPQDYTDSFGIVRGNLFVGTNMSFIILGIGIVSAFLLHINYSIKTYVIIFIITIITLGTILSFSRASGILVMLLVAFVLYFDLSRKRGVKKNLYFFSIVLFFGIVIIKTIDFMPYIMITKYNNVESFAGVDNVSRLNSWSKGIHLFNNINNYLGHGLGTSNPRTSELYNLRYLGHYESGILLTFSESGILGLLILAIPLFYILKKVKQKRINFIFLVWAILLYVNLFVSPSIIGYKTPLILTSLIGLSFMDDKNKQLKNI